MGWELAAHTIKLLCSSSVLAPPWTHLADTIAGAAREWQPPARHVCAIIKAVGIEFLHVPFAPVCRVAVDKPDGDKAKRSRRDGGSAR